MDDILVSVIVATHRREEPLDLALQSIKQQTYGNIEVLVIDDNADAAWNYIVADIAQRYGAVYICNDESLGSAATRNRGIVAATGSYITFLDDDDIYLPDKIRRQVSQMLEKQSDYSLCDIALYSEGGKLVELRTRAYITDYDIDSLTRYHLVHHMTGTSAMMFRAEYLRRLGGFPPQDIGDEFYLLMNAIEAGGVFSYLPYCDVHAATHDSGGLSSGDLKLSGEYKLYDFKKQYFNRLAPSDIRAIKMRHYAVIGYFYIKQKKYLLALRALFISFMFSPIPLIKLYLNRLQRR